MCTYAVLPVQLCQQVGQKYTVYKCCVASTAVSTDRERVNSLYVCCVASTIMSTGREKVNIG